MPFSLSSATALALRAPDLQWTMISCPGRWQLAEPARQLAEGNQRRTRNAADLELVRLAHVEQEERRARVDPRLELLAPSFPAPPGPAAAVAAAGANAAELLVVDRAFDRRMIAADRARRIAPQLQLAELHAPGVVEQQPPDERRAGAENQLDRFGRLDGADDAGQHAQHAAFGAARDEPGWRRLGIEAAIARARRRSRTPTPALRSGRCCRRRSDLEEDARVVDEVARREVVGAVEDDVVVVEELERVRRGEARLVGLDVDLGVERGQAVASGLQLRAADVRRAMQNLSLKVALVDGVEIDDAERADAGRGQVQRRRRSQAAGADAQHAPALDAPLPFHADLRQDEVTAVALDLGVAQFRRALGGRPPGRGLPRRPTARC